MQCCALCTWFHSFFPSELKSADIGTSSCSLCEFGSLSNKHIHYEVPVQLLEIYLHSLLGMEPLKPLSARCVDLG